MDVMTKYWEEATATGELDHIAEDFKQIKFREKLDKLDNKISKAYLL